MALLMCAVLGFSLKQVFSLTYPQFEYIGLNLERLQYQGALNQVFFGISAALGGKSQRDNLYDSAGTLFKETKPASMQYTPEELEAAKRTMEMIQKQQANREVKSDV